MTEERRYRNHEIREILDLAVRDDESDLKPLPEADGLTASELQDVALEVGVAPDRLARAVALFEGRAQSVPRGTTLGMPTSVGRMVSLPRAPTDHEWESLVSELRATFGGQGEVTSRSGVREWSNGSLLAFVEPTLSGYRLRVTDSMVAALGATLFGSFLLAFAVMILVVLLGKDDPGFRFVVPAIFGSIGVAMIAAPWIALPRWANEREAQMESVMGRARALLDSAPADDAERA